MREHVIQVYASSTVIWCDYLSYNSRPLAEAMIKDLRLGEDNITGPHRRKFRFKSESS